MGEPVLGDDLVALGALAAARAPQHPHDGQVGLLQGGQVKVSSLNGLQDREVFNILYNT